VNRIQLATTGLFAAWMAHDLEELATMSGNSRILMTRLPGWLPVPDSAREQGLTSRYVGCGVAAVGLVVSAAAVHGYRTQGRSAFYQNALLGFGMHGLGHLGVSLLTRSYASGAATSPTIVLPFWLWATRALNQAGVPDRRSAPTAIALAAGSIAAGHFVAYIVTKNRPRTINGGSPGPKRRDTRLSPVPRAR
jgi:Protein of unknown function with HXXEE motif